VITKETLIRDFESALGYPYASPGSTTRPESGVDCSGLFVWAYRRQGEGIYHGSNRIWREYTSDKGRIGTITVQTGLAVFKWRDSATTYSDNEGDFHHIGLITSTRPLRIIHASSAAGCVTVDTSLKRWTHWARLSAIDYGGGTMYTATTHADGNSAGINLRAEPGKSGGKIGEIPQGMTVTVVEESGEWARVEYGSWNGWVMRKYLIAADSAGTIRVTDGTGTVYTLTLPITISGGGSIG